MLHEGSGVPPQRCLQCVTLQAVWGGPRGGVILEIHSEIDRPILGAATGFRSIRDGRILRVLPYHLQCARRRAGVRMENQYFALDMESPAAHEMQQQGVCMFYVPELLGALELELFAVLRS